MVWDILRVLEERLKCLYKIRDRLSKKGVCNENISRAIRKTQSLIEALCPNYDD